MAGSIRFDGKVVLITGGGQGNLSLYLHSQVQKSFHKKVSGH